MSYQTSPATVSMPQSGDILLGRYVIEGTISRGGFSTVYRGRQLGVDRTVAIKCLDPESVRLDPAAPQRFAREARMASGLQHPNTITIFDYGRTERGILFLVMEYVEGVSLDRILRYGRVESARAVHLLKQILLSLREAHDKSIIHRDLKPANVMVCDRAGEQDVVKVLDFGIAKALEGRVGSANLTAEVTGSDRVIGTPRYMSPEQLKGEPVSPASDMYSVGLVFFEMLTGRPAIDQGSAIENISVQMSDKAVPVPEDGSVPPHYVPILRKALDKDPTYRFQSAKDFLAALDGRIEGQLTVGRVDEEDGNTRPMAAEEIAAAKAYARAQAADGGINLEPSGAFPLVGFGQSPAYGRPRLLLMFNVLLAVLLVSVGVTLGVLLVTQFGGGGRRSPQEQAVAPPASSTSESVVAMSTPIEPVAVVNAGATPAERSTRAADVRLGVQNAQNDLAWAVVSAANQAQPLVFTFTGDPPEAEIFLGPDRIGQGGQALTFDRQRLPARVEVRHADYLSMYTQLTAERTGLIHYHLLPDPEAESTEPSVSVVVPAAPTTTQPAPAEPPAENPPSRPAERSPEPSAPVPTAAAVTVAPVEDEAEPEPPVREPRRSSRDDGDERSSRSRSSSAEPAAEPETNSPRILLIDESGSDEPERAVSEEPEPAPTEEPSRRSEHDEREVDEPEPPPDISPLAPL